MKVLRILLTCMIFVLAGCESDDGVVITEGPKATALGAGKDEQIKGLTQQVKDEQAARQLEQALAAKASSNFLGVLKALEYVDQSPAREAATEESKLGMQRLGKDDPAETVKALQRVIDIVTGQRDKAMRDYATARGETEAERTKVVEKDREIATRDKALTDRDARIATLTTEAEAEKKAHVDDVKKALAAKDAALKKQADEFASKERRWWINATRITGLGLLVIGALLAVLLKMVPEGAGLGATGLLIGLVSIFVDWLTAQWWFPWLMSLGILGILIAIGFVVYRAWKRHTLQTKVTAAMQDLKDESITLGNDVWEKASEHLRYRLGEKDGAAQKRLAASLGLVNPDAEVKTPPTGG